MADKIAEERTLETMPDDWPVARKVRWRLLHGEQLSTQDVVGSYGGSDTRLIMSVKYLIENGVKVSKLRRGNATYYFVPKRAPRTPRARGAHVNGNSTEPNFTRPAPATPALGLLLRVVMVAEEDGNPVAVLADVDGTRWFAHLEQAPPIET